MDDCGCFVIIKEVSGWELLYTVIIIYQTISENEMEDNGNFAWTLFSLSPSLSEILELNKSLNRPLLHVVDRFHWKCLFDCPLSLIVFFVTSASSRLVCPIENFFLKITIVSFFALWCIQINQSIINIQIALLSHSVITQGHTGQKNYEKISTSKVNKGDDVANRYSIFYVMGLWREQLFLDWLANNKETDDWSLLFWFFTCFQVNSGSKPIILLIAI